MCKMSGAVFNSPIPHLRGNGFGNIVIQAYVLIDGLTKRGIHLGRQSRSHHTVIKDQRSE